jgi:nucleoside-diphosphate-sugar epimerase
MPPLIWGRGTSYFKQQSEQIPQMLKHALHCGRLEYVAPGSSRIGHVYVTDLAALYELIVARALADPGFPGGQTGFFFANTGSHSWLEVAQRAAKVGFERGLLKSAEPAPLEIQDAAAKFGYGDPHKTEYVLASR